MANTIPSANMNLPIPVVGQDPGPDYADNINNSLTIIDQHDHTPGYGVPITPNGLSINTDLTIGANNLTDVRSTRFIPQASPLALPADLGCIYESGVDLYYNDGSGNQIRITQGGGIAGSPGSIANLTSPASASYVSGNSTFVWESNTATPANMDFASAILRNLAANSKGLTLQPPAAMGADYTLTLPTIPVSQQIMTLDNTGNMSAPYTVDGSTIEIASNVIQVKDSGITSAKIAPVNVTQSKLQVKALGITNVSVGGTARSNSSGSFATNLTSLTQVTNQVISLNCTGNRPVTVFLTSDGNTNDSSIGIESQNLTINRGLGRFVITRNGTEIYRSVVDFQSNEPVSNQGFHQRIPPTAISYLDFTAPSGVNIYTLRAASSNTSLNVEVSNCILVAYET